MSRSRRSRTINATRLSHIVCCLAPLHLAAATGCNETIDPVADGFDDEASADGTGGNTPPDVGTGQLDPGECIADEKIGAWGYKHQCNGAFLARVGGIYDEEPFYFYIPSPSTTGFGDGYEPYQQAKVIACCGEFDDEQTLADQPQYGENCLLDFRQQACMSLAAGLKILIDDGTIPAVYKNKAINIQTWIAANTGTCIAGLVDTHTSPNRLEATWYLGSGPWEPQITDAYVKIDFAQLSGVYLPTSGAEICTSLDANNGHLFTDESASPLTTTYDIDLDEADGDLEGPVYGGGRITANADLASLATSCVVPYCSTASLSEDGMGTWAIDRMELYADGSFIISNGTLDETINNGRIELYRQAVGTVTYIGGTFYYTISAGDAYFIVVGENGDVATLPVPNSTDIVATETGGVWSFDSFELEYIDDNSETWTLTINPSEWL